MTTRTQAAATPTETQVLQQVLDALRLFGVDIDRQNSAGFYNPQGQYVRCGAPGNADLTGMLTSGPGRGLKIDLEVKKPGFDPTKLRGKAREHFARQLVRLRKTNENGGYGLWLTDAAQAVHALERINQGWRVEIDDDGWPWLTND